MNRYSGTCTACKREIRAELQLEPDLTPPAVFGVLCPCHSSVVLTLRERT